MIEYRQKQFFTELIQKSLFLVIFLFLGTKATAVNYYINDLSTAGDQYTLVIGNDSHDGLSPASPKLTLQSIYELLKQGDVVYIDTGIYGEHQKRLILENQPKVSFIIASSKEAVFSKNSIPNSNKTNPAEFYIENDKPVERADYLQHKRIEGKRS